MFQHLCKDSILVFTSTLNPTHLNVVYNIHVEMSQNP